jgi:hypothetical protein
MSKADEIAKLFELKKQGILTDAEFHQEKSKLLGSEPAQSTVSSLATNQTFSAEGKEQVNLPQSNTQRVKELRSAGQPRLVTATVLVCIALGLAARVLFFIEPTDSAIGLILVGLLITCLVVIALRLFRSGFTEQRAANAEIAVILNQLKQAPQSVQQLGGLTVATKSADKKIGIVRNPIGKRGIFGIVLIIGAVGCFLDPDFAREQAERTVLGDLSSSGTGGDNAAENTRMISEQEKENQAAPVPVFLLGIGLIVWGAKAVKKREALKAASESANKDGEGEIKETCTHVPPDPR